jgi:KaiC/GvpD/RAD55 family RecA-like ATPase
MSYKRTSANIPIKQNPKGNKIMISLSSVKLPKFWNQGFTCGFPAFDELLGNMAGVYGARPGSVLLLSAPPGTGKSRLSLTIGNQMVKNNPDFKAGYFTGEQSVAAAAIMGKTMEIEFDDNFLAARCREWEQIKKDILDNNLNMVILDSFPMISFELDANGKALDTKAKSDAIKNFAEENGVFVILINHANRRGERGGRNELLHLVDIAYTLRRVLDCEAYDNIAAVEFIPEKNRDGSLIGRAFPFNGKWSLDYPMELASSNGDSGNALDGGKITEKKNDRKNLILQMILDNGNILTREEIDNNQFNVPGIATSGVLSLLREMVEENILIAKKAKTGKRGMQPIVSWEAVNPMPVETEVEDEVEVVEES